MMTWNNFKRSDVDPELVPRLDMVLGVPTDCDLDSFIRGAEMAAALLTRRKPEEIQVHEAGERTMALLRKGLLPGVTLEKNGASWYSRTADDRVARLLVVQFHYPKSLAKTPCSVANFPQKPRGEAGDT